MEANMNLILIIVMAALAVGIFFGLVRAIRGPRMADRIVGINLIGSLTTAMLAVIAVYLKEAWLLDVCLIYCFISFLTVIIIAKISVGSVTDFFVHRPDKDLKDEGKEQDK